MIKSKRKRKVIRLIYFYIEVCLSNPYKGKCLNLLLIYDIISERLIEIDLKMRKLYKSIIYQINCIKQ